ncbi:MAG: M28 family peptidase [Tannerellaceae bacterium]|jgi:Zn-dependent M28 family amino/carboxypeptidase|nr:M28 family peptidase [Tannerellaceae bacterium]
MRKLASTLFLCWLGVVPVVWAQAGVAEGAGDELLFRTSIEELSGDLFGGRKPLTPYQDLTVGYIADKFKELGLQPVGGSYLQEVPMLSVKTNVKGGVVTARGKKGAARFGVMDDVVLWTLRAEEKVKVQKAELVFAGFGINAPEYGWNDYEGIDVKGKIVVVLVNDPGFYDDGLFRGNNYMTYYGRWTYKYEEASRQGAAGVLIIHDTAAAAYNWSVVQNGRSSDVLSLASPTGNSEWVALQGWITGEAAHRLFDVAGRSLDEALAAARQRGFKGFALGVTATIETNNDLRLGSSYNVAGVWPGTDLKDEYIVYSAHWDHLGTGTPIDGDSIYNGADDNASGVAALFVIADKFRRLAEPPRRSILFLSVTGEESGLLGSAYYVEHPLIPLSKTVVNLNIDACGDKARTSEVRASGGGLSKDIDRYIVEAAAAQGKPVRFSTTNPGGGFFRSDHFSFAKAGVPVVLAGGSTPPPSGATGENRPLWGGRNTYHQPSDEYHAWWNVAGSLEDVYLFYGIGLRLANDGYFPKWDDATYKAAREAQE